MTTSPNPSETSSQDARGMQAVTAAVHGVEDMPDLASPSAAPALSQHITSARVFAQQWLNISQKSVVESVSTTSVFIQHWNAAYRPQLERLSSQSSSAGSIRTQLTGAWEDARKAAPLVSSARDLINGDTNKVAALCGDLASDSVAMASHISGEEEAIKRLNQRIADAKSKVDSYHSQDWMFFIPGANIYHAIRGLTDNVAGYQKSLYELQSEKGKLSADASELAAINHGLANWLDAMHVMTNSFGTFGSSMESVASMLGDTLGQLETVDPATFPIWVKAQVATVDANVQQLNALVNVLHG